MNLRIAFLANLNKLFQILLMQIVARFMLGHSLGKLYANPKKECTNGNKSVVI